MSQEEILDDVQNQPEKGKRPVAITVICVLGFIGAALTIPLIFSDLARRVGDWYPPYLGFSAVLGLICMIGLWQMKKWAVYVYTGMVVLNQVVLFAMEVWSPMAIIVPAIVIAIAFAHINKMK